MKNLLQKLFRKVPKRLPDELSNERTYTELDQYRVVLWLALCKCFNSKMVWRTLQDHSGTIHPGWFILGYRTLPGKQIYLYVPIKYWDETSFAVTRKKAPKHDGHTAQDLINRIMNLK